MATKKPAKKAAKKPAAKSAAFGKGAMPPATGVPFGGQAGAAFAPPMKKAPGKKF